MSRLLLLLSVILIFPNLNARLFIKSPEDLAEQFDKIKGIPYRSFVSPDKLNFDKTIVGHLIRPEGDDACEPLRAVSPEGADSLQNPIIIATRDHCSLGHKVHNAQTAGAAMLIVAIDVPDLPVGHHQHHIRNSNIEVIVISKADGDKIFQYFDKALDKPSHETAYIEVSFKLDEENAPITEENYKNNSVILDFWLSSSDTSESTYRILENSKPILDLFKDSIIFTPRYVTWQCDSCRAKGFTEFNDNCLGGGRYCDPEAINDEIQGNEVILEDLRQICIYRQDQELWWAYVEKFGQLCAQQREEFYDTCGNEVLGELQVTDATIVSINSCMSGSFHAKVGDDLKLTNNDNYLLRENLDIQNKMGVIHYPSLFANWNRFTGNLFNTKDVLQFVCGHFINTPDTCNNAVPFIPTETESVEVILFLVLTITIIIMVAVVCYVRLRVKRSVYMEMRDEVGGIVAQYRTFKDRAANNTNLEMSQ